MKRSLSEKRNKETSFVHRLLKRLNVPMNHYKKIITTLDCQITRNLLHDFLLHNLHRHLLLSPMCMIRLFIGIFLESSSIIRPPSSVLCKWLLCIRSNICVPLPPTATFVFVFVDNVLSSFKRKTLFIKRNSALDSFDKKRNAGFKINLKKPYNTRIKLILSVADISSPLWSSPVLYI